MQTKAQTKEDNKENINAGVQTSFKKTVEFDFDLENLNGDQEV